MELSMTFIGPSSAIHLHLGLNPIQVSGTKVLCCTLSTLSALLNRDAVLNWVVVWEEFWDPSV